MKKQFHLTFNAEPKRTTTSESAWIKLTKRTLDEWDATIDRSRYDSTSVSTTFVVRGENVPAIRTKVRAESVRLLDREGYAEVEAIVTAEAFSVGVDLADPKPEPKRRKRDDVHYMVAGGPACRTRSRKPRTTDRREDVTCAKCREIIDEVEREEAKRRDAAPEIRFGAPAAKFGRSASGQTTRPVFVDGEHHSNIIVSIVDGKAAGYESEIPQLPSYKRGSRYLGAVKRNVAEFLTAERETYGMVRSLDELRADAEIETEAETLNGTLPGNSKTALDRIEATEAARDAEHEAEQIADVAAEPAGGHDAGHRTNEPPAPRRYGRQRATKEYVVYRNDAVVARPPTWTQFRRAIVEAYDAAVADGEPLVDKCFWLTNDDQPGRTPVSSAAAAYDKSLAMSRNGAKHVVVNAQIFTTEQAVYVE